MTSFQVRATAWPSRPAAWVERPAALAALDAVPDHRLTVVCAAAGFGKTTLLAEWGRTRPGCHFLAEASQVDSFITGCADGDVVVVDNADTIDSSVLDQTRAHLVLLTRTPLGTPVERHRGRGTVLEVDAATLAFSPAEVAQALPDPTIADEVHRITGGWPAAVVMAARWLEHQCPDRLDLTRLARPGGPLFGYVGAELVGGLSPDQLDLLRKVAFLPRFTAEGVRRAEIPVCPATLAALGSRGVLRPADDGSYDCGPLVREVLGHPDPTTAAALLSTHASALLADGHAADLLATIERLPVPDGNEVVEARARRVLGDWSGALSCLRHAERRTPGDPTLAAELAVTHHLLGEPTEVLAACAGADHDDPFVSAWESVAHFYRNDPDAGRAAARTAIDLAERHGNTPALMLATAAMGAHAALSGDRAESDRWYAQAVARADEVAPGPLRDIVLGYRAFRAIDDGNLAEGVAELDRIITEARRSGDLSVELAALCRRGGALLATGRATEAEADLMAAVAGYRRTGSRAVSRALTELGSLHLAKGELLQANTLFHEAITISGTTGDNQTLGAALTGLARSRVAADPTEAAALAERITVGGGTVRSRALLAAAWIAVPTDPDRARALAARAAAEGFGEARAEAMEVAAILCGDPRRGLREAQEAWTAMGHTLGSARVAAALARLSPGTGHEVETTTNRLRAIGVQAEDQAGLLRHVPVPAHLALRVQVLGNFQVTRSGTPVGVDEWRSKKARDLFKLLVARRGITTPRELLIELLWPEEDPVKCGNRLSVILSIIRTVLDPDRALPTDHFVAADKYSIGLSNLRIDIEEFLQATKSARYHRDTVAMQAAEAMYTGDFLEEDPYEDWTVSLREEAKETYIQLLATLSRTASNDGDHDTANHYRLRLLGKDPYDEEAHLGLVRSLTALGRHGEARRRYALYREALSRLDLPARPFPA